MKTYISLFMILLMLPTVALKAQNVGDAAPDFTLTSDGGTSFTLSAQQGKVVSLFLFGNSCAHCIANGPNTESGIYQELKNNPNFVAVAADVWDGSLGQVQSYKASTGITYPILLSGSSLLSAYTTTYDRLIIIDQQGIIRFESTANASTSVVAQAKAVIDNLLMTADIAEPESNLKFHAYHNASAGLLNFNNPFQLQGLATVRIMDMSGRIVHLSARNLEASNSLDFNPNTRGVYFLSVSLNGLTHLAKVLY